MESLKGNCRLVVFGFGNPGRGDDALALALLQRMASETLTSSARPCGQLIETVQLQIEHALDLRNQDLALFIDASVAGGEPYCFRRLQAECDVTYTTHVMSPAALLYVYEMIEARRAPPAFQLTISGARFALDAPLSETAKQHLDAAHRFLIELCRDPGAARWASLTTPDAA